MQYEPFEEKLMYEWVKSQESASRVGEKTTVVCLQMHNGYEVIGSSSCVNPGDYDFEIGTFYATKDALRKIKEIVGYVNQSQLNK
ncbi:Gp49 family protein [Cytobacillus horneckiae]|uniref:Gp49 family protein n=1 Tax=Cytobacillus horneckiae TaxID=549687 RepID=UPI0034D017D5